MPVVINSLNNHLMNSFKQNVIAKVMHAVLIAKTIPLLKAIENIRIGASMNIKFTIANRDRYKAPQSLYVFTAYFMAA